MTEKSMIMNRKRNRKQCMVKRYSCLFTAILITFLILAVSLSICFTVNADQEKPKRHAYKYYTDIVIQKGESLWDIAKRYRVTCKHAVDEVIVEKLLNGVQLVDEKTPLKAVDVERIDERVLEMTITSGKYHQVKRMIAACGATVTFLKRVQLGGVRLDESLAPGEFRELTEEELEKVNIHPTTIRISIGAENINDLIADFEQAFAKVFGKN